MKKRSLLQQLIFPYIIILLIAMSSIAIYISSFYRKQFIEEERRSLTTQGMLFCEIILRNKDVPEEEIDHLCKQFAESATRFTVIRKDGKVLGDSRNTPEAMDNHADRPEVQMALQGGTGSSIRYSFTLHQDYLYVAIPCRRAGEVGMILRTSMSLDKVYGSLRLVNNQIILGLIVLLIVFILISYHFVRRITIPISRMQMELEELSGNDRISVVLREQNTKEFSYLAHTINHLTRQLQDRISRMSQQKEELHAILSGMTEGVLAIDNDEKVILVNNAAETILGTDTKESSGKTLYEVFRQSKLLHFARTLLQGDDSSLNEEFQVYDETDKWIYAHGSQLTNKSGQVRGAVFVMGDITERKQLETSRREFFANASHELRTPITAVKGFIEALLESDMNDKEEAKRFLSIVQRQTDYLATLVDDMFALARLEQGIYVTRVHWEKVDLQQLLSDIVVTFEPRSVKEKKNIRFECEQPVVVQTDPTLIQQAILNLLDNSFKYTPEETRINLRCREENDRSIIEVEDNGRGIEADHLPHLFERFYRVDKSRSKALGGTGLGLAIVKHITILLGGDVQVESTVGKGTTFTIMLPSVNL